MSAEAILDFFFLSEDHWETSRGVWGGDISLTSRGICCPPCDETDTEGVTADAGAVCAKAAKGPGS